MQKNNLQVFIVSAKKRCKKDVLSLLCEHNAKSVTKFDAFCKSGKMLDLIDEEETFILSLAIKQDVDKMIEKLNESDDFNGVAYSIDINNEMFINQFLGGCNGEE